MVATRRDQLLDQRRRRAGLGAARDEGRQHLEQPVARVGKRLDLNDAFEEVSHARILPDRASVTLLLQSRDFISEGSRPRAIPTDPA